MMSVIKTILGLSVTVTLIWFVIHQYSVSQKYEPSHLDFKSENFEIVALGGGRKDAPENTLQTFEHAVQQNSNVILEMDVQITADKKVIVFNDERLERLTDGTGVVWQKDYSELSKLDAGYHFKNEKNEYSFRGLGYKISLLEDLMTRFPAQRKIIDIKQRSKELSLAVYEILKKTDSLETTFLTSDIGQQLIYLRNLDPRLKTTSSLDEILRTKTLLNFRWEGLDKLGANLFLIPLHDKKMPILDARLIQFIHSRGKKIFGVINGNLESIQSMQQLGVDGIATETLSQTL